MGEKTPERKSKESRSNNISPDERKKKANKSDYQKSKGSAFDQAWASADLS